MLNYLGFFKMIKDMRQFIYLKLGKIFKEKQCHMDLDQGAGLTKEARVNMWDEAHRRTIGWLFDNDYLGVK